jgi:hypothetical protein
MAISGGGIRSATFGLGILQGLARLELLRQFDYLSTVSGGGYIHGWLAAWIKREGDIANVEKQLDPSRVRQAKAVSNIGESRLTHETVLDEEPEPIFHLRSYSNYLTPRPGAFTADTWTLLTIHLRNLLINLLLLVPTTMAVVVLSRFVIWFFASSGRGKFTLDMPGGHRLGPLVIPQYCLPNWAVWGILLVVSIVIALAFVLVELRARRAAENLPKEEREPRFSGENPAGVPFLTPLRWGLLRWLFCPVLFYGGALATWYLVQPASSGGASLFLARWPSQELPITSGVIVRGLFVAALLVGLWSLGLERANLQKSRRGYAPQRTLGLGGMLVRIVWPMVLASVLAPWIFGTDQAASGQPRSWEEIRHWPIWETWPGTLQIVVGFAVPLGLLSLFFSINSVLLGYLDLRGLARLTFSGLAMGALAGFLLQMTLILVCWPLASRPYAIASFAPTLGPYKGKETGETALFRTLLDGLERGEIVLGDRCFASHFMIAELLRRGVDGLFRMHQRRKFDFRGGRQLGFEDHVVTWTKPERPEWMDEETYAQIPNTMEIREFRFKVQQRGFRVQELVLVTTMLDAEEYTKEELADLFLQRWNIELDFRSIKDVLQMDVLRCKTPAMVKKEIWIHLLAYNLIRGVAAKAAEAHDKQPRLISFKGTLQTMTAFQEALRWALPPDRQRLVAAMLRAIAHHAVGDRPGRVEPRANKRRPKCQKLLMEPRKQARKRLMQAA